MKLTESEKKIVGTAFGVFPYIRIHDYVCDKRDIFQFELSSDSFLPKLFLRIRLPINIINETEKLNDGDLISIGIRSDLKVFRPISADFIVTKVDNNVIMDEENPQQWYEHLIWAELNIPLLKSDIVRFSYLGYGEEALTEIAKRVGLGYVQNTNNPGSKKNGRTYSNNKEVWNCFSNPLNFIQDVTTHMWAGVDSFFDSWIDFYSNLVNINVGDILGRTMEDDGIIDMTKYRSVVATQFNDTVLTENELGTLEDFKDNKIFTNDMSCQHSVWYVKNYRVVNNSTQISKEMGTHKKHTVYVQNNGLEQSSGESELSVDIGVWYNPEKIQLGYVTMNGPASEDRLYKKADNGSYLDHTFKYEAPEILPIESDEDAKNRDIDGNNSKSSGNFSKKYFLASEHNRMNNLELEKQHVILQMRGFNNGFARGEKVPCMLYRNSVDRYISTKREMPDNSYLVDMVCSGWFYVRAVRYIFKPSDDNKNPVSDWTTEVTLTRREWFPPVSTATASQAQDMKNVKNDVFTPTSPDVILNDVTSNAKEVNTEKTFDLNTFTKPDTEKITQTINSNMFDEVSKNLDFFKMNEECIELISGIDRTKEIFEDSTELVEESYRYLENNK